MNIEKKPILKTAALTKSFRHSRSGEITALKNINLTIFEGQYVLLKGHSGSGKTTLFTLLAGIAFPTSGCVYFREKNLNFQPGQLTHPKRFTMHHKPQTEHVAALSGQTYHPNQLLFQSLSRSFHKSRRSNTPTQ